MGEGYRLKVFPSSSWEDGIGVEERKTVITSYKNR